MDVSWFRLVVRSYSTAGRRLRQARIPNFSIHKIYGTRGLRDREASRSGAASEHKFRKDLQSSNREVTVAKDEAGSKDDESRGATARAWNNTVMGRWAQGPDCPP